MMRVVGDYKHQGIHDEGGGTKDIRVLTMTVVGDYRHQGTHDENGGTIRVLTTRVAGNYSH